MSADLVQLVTDLGRRARAASLALAAVPTGVKNQALLRLAAEIDVSHAQLQEANRRDLDAAQANALPSAQIDRLTLTPSRLRQLAESVRAVAALPDPVGEVLEDWSRPNGLRIRKVRVPIGVIAIIYEARPNVTVDCAALCLKSGNAAILRGGTEIFQTNAALALLIGKALQETAAAAAGPGPSLPADAVQFIPTPDRAALEILLKLAAYVHCVIPRGGEGLIRFVAANSTIPVIKHYNGVCFVYADRSADPTMAESLVVNAKTQRPGVCNAAEQLLIHAQAADHLLPRLGRALTARGVELRCDPAAAAIMARSGIAYTAAQTADFTSEFLDLILGVRVVDSIATAIAIVNRDGSGHSDAIVTADPAAARQFETEVDSAVVLWNASTRFNDGFEFGYGAEIGISTDRLHARGPMGLRELCTHKFLVEGSGQVRA